jgi:hypothetical protein
VPFFAGGVWSGCLFVARRKQGSLVMVVYALMAVLLIDLFLVVLGDGTKPLGK